MFTSSPAAWLASLTIFVALSAPALAATPAAAPSAQPNPLPYSSAMDGYKPFADEKAIPWKAANETVNSRGGWRAYAREASGESPEAMNPGASNPHRGHPMPAAKEKP